MDDSAISQRIF